MKLKNFLIVFIFFLVQMISGGPSAEAEEFVYKYRTGDKYRILSTVNHDIFVNRRLGYRSEIVNRITVEITGVSGNTAHHSAVFQSAEKTVTLGEVSNQNQPKLFQWARDYPSEYEQDIRGLMTVDDRYYMPMVRNVPVFPARDLKPGDTWVAAGTEVHDFRDNFGIEKPFQIPITVHYTFLGERTWKGERYPAFSVSYRIFFTTGLVSGKVVPRRIVGASDQVIYWDLNHGQAAAYEEQFRTVIYLSNGETWEYSGRAEAEVVESPPMDKDEMFKDIAADIRDIPDASVRVSDEGIVISLENIQFAPDSAILMGSERSKLDIIAEILMKYPNRDILVGGHTALAGNAAGRLQLSLERAGAVADYLMGKNVRSPERVVIRGYGADIPLADNRTEEGMMRNRRVEITILEN